MKKYHVKMVCREISRADVIIECEDDIELEEVKDRAWATFDNNMTGELEQENFTKVHKI
jgi:hypothetical protein